MIRIGSLELGTKPHIAAIVDEFIPVEKLAGLPNQGVDLLEMRVDCYSQPLDEIISYLIKVRDAVRLPMIGTVRETDKNKNIRPEIFRRIMPFVDSIDIELGTPASDEILSLAKDKTIIVSEHDFVKTPSSIELEKIVERSLIQGAHIVKIAAMANSKDDVTRLLRFTHDCKEPLVTISMGPIGTVSRVIAPLFGSLYTYGYIVKPVAPGQLSVQKLAEEMRLFFPEFF